MSDLQGIEWVALSALHPNPANPRHNDAGVEHVAASIRRFGWQQPLVAKRDGEIIAGHTRFKAAQAMKLETVPVIWFEGSDLDATAFGVADNKTHDFSTWDDEALAAILQALRAEDALEGVGFSEQEMEELLASVAASTRSANEDAGPQKPPENPVTRRGDLWLLGDHRLLNGDSTNVDDMAKLMRDDVAVLLATDPPYLVDYTGSNHPAEHHKKKGRKKADSEEGAKPANEVGNKHWDAYIDPKSSVEFFANFLRVALKHCIERVPIYQWHASRRQMLVEQAWEENELLVHQTIIWVKTRGILTRSFFLWKHEPAFFGWRKGFMPEKERRPPSNETTVWEIGQAGENDGIHPTQKPLEIFLRPIEWHAKPGEVVLEPFNGSGSQLIAAEKLARKCRSMELSPAFVDAALRRWEKTTGKQATLDGDGRTFAEIAAERGVPVPE